jgi:cytochrome c biogenesis protein CcmG, thiol:disulfide interchange protein DsbE
MRRWLGLAIAAALVLAGCAERPAGRTGVGQGEPIVRLLPRDRLALPTFDLPRFQSLLQELRGTPVVVNIWAAWCPPCRVEAPGLAAVAREFQEDVQFLGVDILDNREDARRFILEFDWPYPSVFDPDGAIRDGLGYLGQPVTIVYDRHGNLVFDWEGAVTEEMLRREIRKVIR